MIAREGGYASGHPRRGYACSVCPLYSSDNDSLGIDDPDLLDIPPPMTYEAWSADGEEFSAE